ncbi:hypothetical protein [Nonomuraea endophytica]|uniref:Uncharacterized protein n=1 Tax=Nonomuraea endophytica TaxID=714136 RepID=A0A7W8EGV8_9ACTN|nr:hypothetical protein [Nonomuraea endophytica]MBB5080275.1 hypothetical protein [Nonomuraea endophytica]
MTDISDMADWELMRGDVSAADIKAAHEAALARHTNQADKDALQASLRRVLASCGGSWERLAEAWTTKNWLRAFREELHGKGWMRVPDRDELRDELRDLIRQYPGLAREILGEDTE